MGAVVFDISMSLDGYVTAAGRRPEEPMGVGGEGLHEWAFGGDPTGREVLAAAVEGLGAVITGRRNYDDSVPWWGADGPTGPARVPTIVVTHQPPEEAPDGGVYAFETSLGAALDRARAAAGDRVVCVMGGADLGRQFLDAGLVDEVSIHLVPVLFGSGTRLLDQLTNGHIDLEPTDVLRTPSAIHLRFRVRRAEGQPTGDASPSTT